MGLGDLLRRKKGRQAIAVVVATRNPAALAALEKFSTAATMREAFTTEGVYSALSGAQLAVVDPEDLVEKGMSRQALLEVLQGNGVVWARGEEIAADPARFEQAALAAQGRVDALPPQAVAIANYSGGVGKTTLSLDLAVFVREKLGLPTCVVEVCYGTSALRAMCDPNLPHLYEIFTQSVPPGRFRGVDIIAMEYDTAQMIFAREMELREFLSKIKRDHVLTVFDCNHPHPIWHIVQSLSDRVIVPATTRPDCLANSRRLVSEIEGAVLVGNRVGTREKVLLQGVHRALDLPEVEAPERFTGELGRRLMPVVYPGWRES